MKKKNNKGFTLIELLVTITILGILTIVALPSVRRVQTSNRTKKFDSYSESIKSASKAYVDSYEEDLFNDSDEESCATITLEELIDKKLIKDIKLKDITCANPGDTRVQVRKKNKKFYYQVYLKCTNKNNKNTVQYQSDYYSNNSADCISSDGPDIDPPIIKINT